MALGVGRGETAAATTRAGDGPGEDGARGVVEPGGADGFASCFHVRRWDVGDQQVLPDGEAHFPAAEALCNLCKRTCLLGREPADRRADADIVQALLHLRMDAEVAGAIDGATWFALFYRYTKNREGKLRLAFGDKLFHAPLVHKVLQPCLLAVGAITVFCKHANHRSGYRDELIRP